MKTKFRLVCLLLLCLTLLCVGCTARSSKSFIEVSKLYLPEKSEIVKIVVEDSRTFEETEITNAATVAQIYDALDGIELSYTESSSKGIYNSVFSLTFYGSEDRQLGYPICFYPEEQGKCEHLPSYDDYGYWNVFEMRGASALYDAIEQLAVTLD